MSVEIVCEWIERTGGAERVLDAMIDAFPGAPVHALWNDAEERMAGVDVHESWLARTPLRHAKALALPLFDPTWRRLRLAGDPDKVLISSYVFAHHAITPRARKYVYVHSPARYIWNPEVDPRGRTPLVRATRGYWQRLDRRRAAEAHRLAANSDFVRDRIAESWGRGADVIYPPVDTTTILAIPDWEARLTADESTQLRMLPTEFILGASRLVRYKGLEEVLAFAASVGLPAVVAGEGPDLPRLREKAARLEVPAVFTGPVSDAMLFTLYQRAVAFVFPPIEDFGIMPVEAMAAGARVIVNSIGGTAETVVHGRTGAHARRFDGQDARDALETALGIDPDDGRADATRFSRERFIRELTAWVSTDQPSEPA